MIINEFIIGFCIGFFIWFIIWKILYHIVWYNFKQIGKKHNLKTIRCEKCKNYFYIFKSETTKLCCNCIALGIAKNELF